MSRTGRVTCDHGTHVQGLPVRAARQPRTAFVLSGGGNQGVSQVGMLRALARAGHRARRGHRTSVGALNGAVVANRSGDLPDRPPRGGLGRPHERAGVPRGTLRRAWNLLRRDDHLISNEGLREMIDGSLSPTPSEAVGAAAGGDGRHPVRSRLVFAAGDLRRPCWPAPPSGDLPARAPGRRGPRRRRHRQPRADLPRARGPIDRIFVLDVSDPMNDRRSAHPRTWWSGPWPSRATSASSSSSSGCHPRWSWSSCPARRQRDFFDFGGARQLIDRP